MGKDLMNRGEILQALKAIGFPIPTGVSDKQFHEIVHDFQRGYAFATLLTDGYAGPKTQEAIKHSRNNGGKCSPHFRYREFASKGNTDWTIKVHRYLVRGLEDLRDKVGHPIGITSGYRDVTHNRNVGGASNSQHVYGNAVDCDPDLKLADVRAVKRFSGIGIVKATGRVAHFDVRHKGPNTTGGTPNDPTVWYYG